MTSLINVWSHNSSFQLPVSPDDTIGIIKNKLIEKTPESQKLSKELPSPVLALRGQVLADDRKIADLQLRPSDKLMFLYPLVDPEPSRYLEVGKWKKRPTEKASESEGNRLNSLAATFEAAIASLSGSSTFSMTSGDAAQALQTLKDMGFPENRCKKALLLNNMDVEAALGWICDHIEDPLVDEPMTDEELRRADRMMRDRAQKQEEIAAQKKQQEKQQQREDLQACIEHNTCTYVLTGPKMVPVEEHYMCFTCNLEKDMGCCPACAQICHRGHVLYRSVAKLEFYCDCPATGNCKCCPSELYNYPGGADNYAGVLKQESIDTILGYKFWVNEVNAKGGIKVNDTTFLPVNLTIIDIGNTNDTQYPISVAAINSSDFDFFFGPFSSSWTINVAQAFVGKSATLLAGHAAATTVFECQFGTWETRPPCTAPGTRRFANVYGITPVGEEFFTAPINLVALRGAKTIAGWYQDEDFTRGVVDGTYVAALSSGITPIAEPFVMSLNASQQEYNIMTQKLKDLNPDVVVAGSRVESCAKFIIAAKSINWIPKALMTVICVYDVALPAILDKAGLSMDDARYIIDFQTWDSRLRGPEFEDPSNYYFPPNNSLASPAVFADAWKESHDGMPPNPIAPPLSVAMGYSLEATIVKVKSIDRVVVEKGFSTLLMNSFFGKLAFNGFGQNDAKSIANVQLGHRYALDIISPLSSTTAPLVYPMPTWEERTFHKRPFSHPTEQVIAVFVALAILFSLAMAVLTFIYRHNKAIIASSPLFLYMMIVGSLLIYSGILTWTLTTSSVQCMAHWWLFGIGFILMFGGLLVKVWRISMIFNTNHMSVITISSQELLVVVGVGLVIELILLIVWTAVDPSKAVILATDPIRPSLDYMKCSSSTTSLVILILAAIYKGSLVVVGVYLSIRTWKIKYSLYNESRSVAFSMYNLFFFTALAVIIQLVINNPQQRFTQFFVRSAAILLGVLVPIAVIFIPKFTRLVHLKSDNIGMTSGGGSTQLSSHKNSGGRSYDETAGSDGDNGNDSYFDKQLERLQEQNSRLKEEVKKLRSRVHELEMKS